MNVSNEQPESDVSNSGYFSKEYFRILYALCQSAELAFAGFLGRFLTCVQSIWARTCFE